MKKFIGLLSVLLPTKIRIFVLNKLGHQISKKAILGKFSIVLADKIILEDNSRLEPFSVVTGIKLLHLKRGSGISSFAYISGNHKMILDERALIGSRSIVNTGSGDVIFGKYSVLSPRSTIYTHGTFLPITHGYSVKNKGVSVGNYTWIMQNTSIGPGVVIGSNIIVLPGSVVVKEVKDNTVVYDTPVERKTYPMDIFKRKMTNDKLENQIKDITISFMEYLIKNEKISSYNLNQNEIQIKSQKQNLVIYFEKPPINCTVQNSCYFSHNIDSKIIKSAKVFVLDFSNLTCSNVTTPKILRGYNEYMFYHYGLKFLVNKD